MIGIRSAISIRARGHRPHLEAVYMTAPRSACRNTKKLLPRGGRPYMTKEQAVGSLALPVADAARLAGPHLDPRVEGLRVQGVAVSSRQFGPNRAARFLRVDARFLRTHMRNPGAGNHDPFGLDEFGLGCRLSARLCALAS